MALISTYNESNRDSSYLFYTGQYTGMGQALTLTSTYTLTNAVFYIQKNGAPTGNGNAKLYAVTGTVGTDGRPTGTALATSDNVDMASLVAGVYQQVDFLFSGPNRYIMTPGNYAIVFEWTGGDVSNNLAFGIDLSSPSHTGNRCHQFAGSWAGSSTEDSIFYLYGSPNISSIRNNLRPRAFTPGLAR